jgi:hypothetical protein
VGAQTLPWPGQYLGQQLGTGYDINDVSAMKMINLKAKTVARSQRPLFANR